MVDKNDLGEIRSIVSSALAKSIKSFRTNAHQAEEAFEVLTMLENICEPLISVIRGLRLSAKKDFWRSAA